MLLLLQNIYLSDSYDSLCSSASYSRPLLYYQNPFCLSTYFSTIFFTLCLLYLVCFFRLAYFLTGLLSYHESRYYVNYFFKVFFSFIVFSISSVFRLAYRLTGIISYHASYHYVNSFNDSFFPSLYTTIYTLIIFMFVQVINCIFSIVNH